MPLSLQFYSVTINNGISTAAPGDGFIDNQRIENYYVGTSLATTPSGFSSDLSLAKRRANYRYQEMIRQIQLVSNCTIDPNTIVATGGSATVAPTAFAFQMIGPVPAAWVTADESNVGQYLVGTACIKRCIARALIADVNWRLDIFDPTSAETIGNTTSVPRYGTRLDVAATHIGPYAANLAAAEAQITVTTLH